MQQTKWVTPKPEFTPRPEQLRGMELILQGGGARIFLHPGR